MKFGVKLHPLMLAIFCLEDLSCMIGKLCMMGFKHIYSFEKNEHKVTLAPLKPSLISKPSKGEDKLLLIKKGDF